MRIIRVAKLDFSRISSHEASQTCASLRIVGSPVSSIYPIPPKHSIPSLIRGTHWNTKYRIHSVDYRIRQSIITDHFACISLDDGSEKSHSECFFFRYFSRFLQRSHWLPYSFDCRLPAIRRVWRHLAGRECTLALPPEWTLVFMKSHSSILDSPSPTVPPNRPLFWRVVANPSAVFRTLIDGKSNHGQGTWFWQWDE